MSSNGGLRIGASSVADLCGYGYNSRQKLWRIKTGREDREPANAYMLHGVQHEQKAIAATECDLGRIWSHTSDDKDKQYKVSTLINGKGVTEVMMLFDGIDLDAGEALEVKCPQRLKDEVALKYLIQMQTGFWLDSSLKRILYAEWSAAETRKWWVYPSLEFGEVIYKAILDFVGYVESNKEPPKWSSKANPKPKFPDVRTERV